MKNEILSNLGNPGQLERLYRSDKTSFTRAFQSLYPEINHNELAGFWNERLNFAKEEISWGSRKDLLFVIAASLVAGLVAKLPALLNLNEEFFYTRNAGFIVFPLLSVYFAWKNKISPGKIAFLAATTLGAVVFINLLPDVRKSDTLVLSCIHLLLFLWSLLGFAFVGSSENDDNKRLSYLKYNGDLVVMTTLILIAGGYNVGYYHRAFFPDRV